MKQLDAPSPPEPGERSQRSCRWPAAAALAFAASNGTAPASGAIDAVRLEDHGAVCDGVTDDAAAIRRAIERGRQLRLPVRVPVGRCAFGDVIRLHGVTLRGTGAGSQLYALDWARSAIFMSGASPAVLDLTLSGVPAPSRKAPWEMTRITIIGATEFAIERVVIEGSAAAGIQTAQAPTRGRIVGNVVRNTLSDGIHLTDGASHVLIEGNLVEQTGDDGIAVVSYWSDALPVSDITARNNVVRKNHWGRNMSVVGGRRVRYENNLLQGNLAGLACLYIAQEDRSMRTKGATDVTADRNTLENCGGAQHAAVMIFSDGNATNERIRLRRNDIRPGGPTGIRVFSPWNVDVLLEANRIAESARPLDVSGPSVSVIPYADGPVGHRGE